MPKAEAICACRTSKTKAVATIFFPANQPKHNLARVRPPSSRGVHINLFIFNFFFVALRGCVGGGVGASWLIECGPGQFYFFIFVCGEFIFLFFQKTYLKIYQKVFAKILKKFFNWKKIYEKFLKIFSKSFSTEKKFMKKFLKIFSTKKFWKNFQSTK